ncbi:MAG: NAD(P)H-dependent oxidoreductase [Balneolaceae bacterium]|nr:NAD(P)H-dependent oxidoreductase [Balneolaceae bacterium]
METVHKKPLKIIAIQGSIRENNYTSKALSILSEAAGRVPGLAFEIVDPRNLVLPLPGEQQTEDVSLVQQKVEDADGVILATPEYHGSYSSVMKLVIDNLGFPSVLQDKPTALLGVAAGRIGAIKALEHLRSVASHVGAIVLPEVVSIARVRDQFDEHDHLKNEELRNLLTGLLGQLIRYLSKTERAAAAICEYSKN